MTAKPKPVVIRAGDRVRVVDPRWVLRVGYPKTAADYLAATCERHEAALREIYGYKAARPTLAAALAVDFPGYTPPSAEERVSKMPRPLRRALWDLAYLACERDGFGGKERRIHLSEPLPDWEGAEFEVASVRSAMEGDYFPPYYGTTYEGECDNEPGGLENQRVRRLVAVGRLLAGESRRHLVMARREQRIEFPVEHLALVVHPCVGCLRCRSCVGCESLNFEGDVCEDCGCETPMATSPCDGSGFRPAKRAARSAP